MTTNIENTDILIHRNRDTLPLTEFASDEYFGILTVKMAKTNLVKTPTLLLFTIDKTGSMGERASGKSTKMAHVIQTFNNMMNYLSKLEMDIYIQVNTFNTKVNVLVNCVKISVDNVEEIINKIKQLTPDGCTDIGVALEEAADMLSNYSAENTTHQIGHIFMTDGTATAGIRITSQLAELVNEEYTNIFVGFGFDHNVELLNNLSSKRNAEYQFVDNMENTALVYGETIHRFIYPALRDAEFHIENGLIYDWQKNEWTTSIQESVIVSEVEKIYHIKTTNPDNVQVLIYGVIVDDYDNENRYLVTAIPVPDLINGETNEPMLEEDLTKYAFRQKVQELLYAAKKGIINKAEKIDYKIELKELFRTIRKYMRLNNMKEDGLLQLLCDDISQIYNTLETMHGRIYATARCTSQGRQRTYNTNSTFDSDDVFSQLDRSPSYIPPPPRLIRTNAMSYNTPEQIIGDNIDNISAIGSRSPSISLEIPSDDINDATFYRYDREGFITRDGSEDADTTEFIYEDEIEYYISPTTNTTCFSTPGILDTMRSMSQR